MSKRYLLRSVAVLVFFSSAAIAQENQDQNVPCFGPLCVATPFWKLGRAISGSPRQSVSSVEPTQVRPADPQPVAESNKTDSLQRLNTAAGPAPTEEGRDGSGGRVGRSDDGQGNRQVNDVGIIHRLAIKTPAKHARNRNPSPKFVVRNESRVVAPAARRETSSLRKPSVFASKAAPRGEDQKAVTIAANETEVARVLRLARLVTTPSIHVVPAVSGMDGCRQKPADFVVDTMSNPNRVGPAIPLFSESLIIVARNNIRDVSDLRGRQVSFGLSGSASQRVSNRVFRALNVDVHEQPLDLGNAIDALTLGDLDAVVLLAPQGFSRLAQHDPSLHLLTLPDRFGPADGLRVSRIDPSSYLGGKWSNPSVSVVTVEAVLSPNRASPMRPTAQAVFAALNRRSVELAANGFDLIGGSGELTTMRSIAHDITPPSRRADAGC